MHIQEGILCINKPEGKTSFSLVSALRRLSKIQTIGHAGTLDPFASGVMVMLVGRTFTKQAETFLNQSKAYEATVHLGIETTTYDPEGEITFRCDRIPLLKEIETALLAFQGEQEQLPPMFSAKKIQGKKLYELARKGIEIERKRCCVNLNITLKKYEYPYLFLLIECSKGTYIRTLAYDLGRALGCGAYLSALVRTKSGPYLLQDCLDGSKLFST